jgi:hypothetical protein
MRNPPTPTFVPCHVRRGYTTYVIAAVHRSPRWPETDGSDDVDQQPWHVCEIYGTVRTDGSASRAVDAVLADDTLRANVARGLNAYLGYTYDGKPYGREHGERIFAVFPLEDMLWIGTRLPDDTTVNTRISTRDGKAYRYIIRY